MRTGLRLIKPVLVVTMMGLILMLWLSQRFEQLNNVFIIVVFSGFLSVLGLYILSSLKEVNFDTVKRNVFYVVKGKEKLPVDLKELVAGGAYQNQPIVMGYRYIQFSLNPNSDKNFSHSYEGVTYESEPRNTIDLLLNFDAQGNIKFISDNTLELLDLSLKEIIGQNILDYQTYFNLDHDLLNTIKTSYRAHSAIEIVTDHKKKRIFWTFEAILNGNNELALVIAQGHEISQYFKASYDDVLFTQRDHLTGLLNQTGLYETIKQLDDVERAVAFFIDIKSFSKVNDLFGHQVGDEVLISIARTLEKIGGPNALVSRFSGDEFVVFCTNNDATDTKISECLNGLKTPQSSFFEQETTPYSIEKTIGYAIYPEDTRDIEQLVGLASLAINETKTNGKRVKRYSKEIKEKLKKQHSLTSKLKKAIEDEIIEIYFQEVIDTKTNEVKYVEELARWQDRTEGFIRPEEFIHLARNANILDMLDRYLVEKAFQSFIDLRLKDRYKHTKLSLNIAPESLLNLNFLHFLKEISYRYAVNPNLISIEISETTFMNNLMLCVDRIKLYKAYGFNIALDDFGREYSSLAVLENVPFDVIKIDAVFISNIHTLHSKEIVRMIRNITLISNKEMIAEGVETPEQSDILKSLGCTMQQGFFYHHPEKVDN